MGSSNDVFRLRLYVAGEAPQSVRALRNLKGICDTHLRGRHHLEVVDVLSGRQAQDDEVYMTPTLVVVDPPPPRRLTGDLSNTEVVLQSLGLR